MGNAMTTTDTSNLDKLRHALLQLHKALLDAQRIRYERENGRIESRGELLALVLEDASFEWLRVLSALIARLDELAEADDKDARAEMRGVIERLRTLVRFEGNDGFTGPYREIVDAVPDALAAEHERARRPGDERVDDRAEKRRPEAGDAESLHEGRHEPEEEPVDHEDEQSQRENGDGQGQEHEQRPDQRVDEPQQQRRDERGVEALHLHRGHEVGKGEQRERVDQPDEEEARHG